MNYQEYCETIKGVVIPKTLVFDIGYLWFHHDRLPLKLVSLGNTSTPVINVPSRVLNSYGKMVPVTDISKTLLQRTVFSRTLSFRPASGLYQKMLFPAAHI